MIIFSERVNGMYRDVRRAIGGRDKSVVQKLTREQVAGGADVMDLNVGPSPGDAADNFVWLAETVHEVTDKPISLDSAKPDLLVKVVPRVRERLPKVKIVINSSTADPDCMEKLVPLAAAHQGGIIGLTMDKGGVPGDVEKRVECGANFLMKAIENGISPADIYLDTIILPINVSAKGPYNVMEGIRQLRIVNDPPPHFIIGLSNVSQKCLLNRMLNRICLVMAMAAGLDAAIMDAADKDLVESAITAEVLLDRLLYSDDYLKAWRMQKGLA